VEAERILSPLPDFTPDWGHYTADVALAAEVGRLALFHHDPIHDDAMMERMERSASARVAERGGSLEVFAAAIKNVAPAMEVKSKRVGGANYQIPFPVRGERRQALAFRWILGAARSQKGKPMAEKLGEELLAASNNEGAAVKKRMDVARMAEANRAFAHFAW